MAETKMLRPATPVSLLDYSMGSPTYLGSIIATTTKNNHDTATPFNNTGNALGGKMLMLQASAACHILQGTTNGAVVTTDNGVKIAADERVYLTMKSNEGWLAVVGGATVKVWEMG